ncbi:LOW QUALITY PROTEIN: alpha-L-iduronidase [Triplophysa dalaica]|uniref:LOW QUALITY PROTEIN: alpha-L-iduronidase n=1 Tax=Triplophysa dalaica TaxID=1582913 RepID=UPI0024DFA676|nr:LOW QUALITY PROTEIN: alpha-L-iduronidase [Triplophysa dalaica]
MHTCKQSLSMWTVFLTLVPVVSCSSVEVQVKVDKPLRNLQHFWRSTGFCPPQPHTDAHLYDLSKDQQMNLALIGSVPHRGLQQVRIHWMLELVSAQVSRVEYHYNFTDLDQLIDLLWQNGLQPGFELMGSVSNTFSNFEDKRQVTEWRNLVYLTAKRYMLKYGLGSVSQWNFETWNEPNNHDFDNISVSLQGFLNYYDACSEGLRAASPLLKFGGPGDSCHSPPHSPYCWEMLQHCYNGTNYFTGESGVRLDYIALHKKGGGSTLPILQQEVATVQEIQQRFPRLRSVPVYNDEADPLVGWNKALTWRGDVTYAAMVVKVISQHQNLLIADQNNTVNYTLLSNDNAFLSYHPHPFTQRTLTARFQINDTNPPHVQLLRKPVLTVMGLLALLGETQVQAEVLINSSEMNSSVGVLASVHLPRVSYTADSWQTTVLLYNSKDNQTSNATDFITLRLTGIPKQTGLMYVTHYMDNNVTNPFKLWDIMGRPDYPTTQQFTQLRSQEDPRTAGPLPVHPDGSLTLKTGLDVPSLLLVHVCAKSKEKPDQVNGVRFIAVTKGQVLIVWKDHCIGTKCIKTYEVEFSKDESLFKRINHRDTIFTHFTYSPDRLDVSGYYRVRVVDYWDRHGEYSLIENYSEKH